MLPRNHSLTSMVQLMPQYERSYIPSSKGSVVGYDSAATSATDYPYQNGNPFMYGNLPFPPDYGNSFIASSSHELYRNLPYWHAVRNVSFVLSKHFLFTGLCAQFYLLLLISAFHIFPSAFHDWSLYNSDGGSPRIYHSER